MSSKSIDTNASYLRDAVFAASDGVITTFAVVAGATGASLSSEVILILGFANLFADGFSMSAGNYLGIKSEKEYKKSKGESVGKASTKINPTITLFSFVIAGAIPLLPFLFEFPNAVLTSIMLVGITMFVIGVTRSRFTNSSWIRSGLETLAIGFIAATVAFAVGIIIDRLVL